VYFFETEVLEEMATPVNITTIMCCCSGNISDPGTIYKVSARVDYKLLKGKSAF